MNDTTQRNLAYAVLGAFFSIILIVLLMNLTISEQMKTLLDIWATSTTAIIFYYFGSSRGSAQKSDALAEVASKKGL